MSPRYPRKHAAARTHRIGWSLILGAALVLSAPHAARAHITSADLRKKVRIDTHFGKKVPLDLQFRDSKGRSATLKELIGNRPAIIAMVYYKCPMLCSLVMKGIVESLNTLSLDMGKDFRVLTVSVNPSEGPADALRKRKEYEKRYNRAGFDEGWRFLTGKEDAIKALASSLGIHYVYDPEQKQYAHPAAIEVLTPDGTISRYLYGIEYAPRDLRLSLVDAAGSKIGTFTDQVFLLCYQYDPVKGKYGFAIMSSLRIAGAATVLLLGGFMFVMLRRERKHR